ncbi:MAG: sugar transferase [Chlamydiota bacterium]
MSDFATPRLFTACPAAEPVSRWCLSAGKRGFDAVFAALVLLCGLPLMLLIAVLIKITSPGPILFQHTRVGQGGVLFSLIKFRSMSIRASGGSNLTRSGDSRVTPVGRFLRRTKLDELPQMYNVLRGDMSLVGPRPDVPEFMDTLSDDLRPVLLLRPGVTSLASISYRDEEAVLAAVPAEQMRSFYIEQLLPRKIALDLQYARAASFASDLKLIAWTAAVMLPLHSARTR